MHDTILLNYHPFLSHSTSLSSFSYYFLHLFSSFRQMSLKLDTSRNELLMANTTLTIATVAIGFSAYVTGVYGMNLDQTTTIQPVYGVFETVFTVTFALIFIITGLIWYYYKRTGVLPSTIRLKESSD